jgi:hypothetical protein
MRPVQAIPFSVDGRTEGKKAGLDFYPLAADGGQIQINLYRLPLPNLPAAFEGFRIVQLSDLHLGRLVPLQLLEWVVEQANALPADIIVGNGDYVQLRNTRHEIEAIWPVLCRLKAPLGVYSVLGNHDHWADSQRSLAWLERSGQNLRHRAVAFERNGARLWLGGAGDLWTDEDGIDQAFAGVPPEACKILLAHNPFSIDLDFKTRLDLVLSGHTHGGQVQLNRLGPVLIPPRYRKYVRGWIETPKAPLFIGSGLGWTILPFRINCPAEIAILELIRGI